MIKAFFKGRQIKLEVETFAQSWTKEFLSSSNIWNMLRHDVEKTIIERVLKDIELTYDKEVVQKIANTFISEFDLKPVIEGHLREKFASYIAGSVNRRSGERDNPVFNSASFAKLQTQVLGGL